ncbi:hypothetical protein EV122DRAFT_213069 [Schizophyllum commune]|nr:hypothetical protein K525DRAFT_191300 [Schizophyllum commune Loenen D]KAI5823016.1 hypothetical protein K523DRAFT_255953 [Schizophyllum commune Tattone D]
MPSPTESPWPQQTPAPDAGPSTIASQRKRRRTSDRSLWQNRDAKLPRQDIADQAAIEDAMYECEIMTDNSRLSCFPTADTVIAQHQYASFVWNSRLPQYAQRDLVDIYLFQGDTLQQILYFPNETNPKYGTPGVIRAQVNDSWWGDRGENWDGSNTTYPFYWVVTPAGNGLDGTETTQTIFSAVQTTYADSVVSSMSASSASASSASAASASASLTSSANGASSTGGGNNSDGSDGGLQSGDKDGGFPHWAIAVIVVLGFLAVAASCVLAFLIIRRMRRQRELESQRNSMGSSSPMMQHVDNGGPASPLLVGGAAGVERQLSSAGHGGQNAPSIVSPDGASTISHANSAGENAPFSGADAAIMADAFRKALRKPDFAAQPVEEGESPENKEPPEEELINRQLAEEGRDIRSVSSSRGVRVETLSDADTATDHQH